MVAAATGRNAMNKLVFATAAVALCTSSTHGASFAPAAKATNEFGIDLYRKIAPGEKNVCISPYSISCALAMTLDGADGETRREMARVLHLDPNIESDSSFAALQESLGEIGPKTAKIAGNQSKMAGRVNRSQSRSRIDYLPSPATNSGLNFSPRSKRTLELRQRSSTSRWTRTRRQEKSTTG